MFLEVSGRIYQGTIALGRPYQLFLFINPQPTFIFPPDCGATLISDDCALTAAHCVTKEGTKTLEERVLLGGESYFKYDPAMQGREFPSKNNVFINENWDGVEDLDGFGKFSIHRYKIRMKI